LGNHLVVELFLLLGVIIAAAQLFGAAARRLGQPRVFGELLAGVVLGPSVIDLLHRSIFTHPDQLAVSVQEFAELGVLFLMFTIGLEVHLHELVSVGRAALWGGTLGALVPVGLTVPIVIAFDYPSKAALFTGVVLAATSVSISAQTMLELGILRTKEGIGLLATAVVDDVLAILLVSVVLALFGSDSDASVGELIWIFVRMALYLAGALAVAWMILPRLFNRIHRTRLLATGTVSFALIMALIFGWSAEALGGIATITGAFIAGLGLGQANPMVKSEIETSVQQISYSFLVPIFFVNVGLHIDLSQIESALLPLTGLLILVAAVTKVAGSGLGARLGGFASGEAFRLGVCMISRGEVGLIIAAVGLAGGLLSDELFQAVFLVILVTTVMTPPLVRLVFRERTTPAAASLPREY
jgi:Kef-type K+ transport system membrane component KefB